MKRIVELSKKILSDNIISYLIIFLIIYMMIVNIIISTFNISSIIRYLSDIIIIILGIYILKNFKKLFQTKSLKIVTLLIIFFFISTIISYFINKIYSPFLYIWGIRNILRFFIVFLSSILAFKSEDISKFFKAMDILFIINIIICFYQYFMLGFYGDTVAGTFKDVTLGGNAGILFITLIETIHVLFSYSNKKCSVFKLIFVIIFSIIICIFAELKIFFLFFIFIVFCWILTNKPTKKLGILLLCSIVLLCIGFNIFKKIDPESANRITFEGMIKYVNNSSFGYSSKNDLNRIRAISQINEQFFEEKTINKLFGFGLGNCDVSRISFFRSQFYDKYNYLHYTWFMHAMLFLETGYIGLILYIVFLIGCIYFYFDFKDKDRNNILIYNFGIVFAIYCIIMIFYNSSLRMDISFFVYLTLAIPFVQYKYTKISKNNSKIIKTREQLIDYLKYERRLYFNASHKYNLTSILMNEPKVKIWKYIKLLRITEYYHNMDKTIYRYIMYTIYNRRKNTLGIKLGIEIWENNFDKGLLIKHGNIIIDRNCRIGKNCILYGNNYIGNNGNSSRVPIIGDNVEIGIGSKILGKVVLSNNIKVKAEELIHDNFKK